MGLISTKNWILIFGVFWSGIFPEIIPGQRGLLDTCHTSLRGGRPEHDERPVIRYLFACICLACFASVAAFGGDHKRDLHPKNPYLWGANFKKKLDTNLREYSKWDIPKDFPGSVPPYWTGVILS